MNLVSSDKISPELIELLSHMELGTNGARYIHLDTKERIKEADNPVSYSLNRNGRIIANVTFCIREIGYYLRYFAFSVSFQSKSKRKSAGKAKSTHLEQQISLVFDQLEKERPNHPLYAYIDLENDRSRLFSERFGFEFYSHIVSRTYSRKNPKKDANIVNIKNWNSISKTISDEYGADEFYHEAHIKNGDYIGLTDNQGNLIAFAKFTKVHWRILSLPGRFGSVLVKVLPYLPILNKLINPKDHFFIVPDVVYSKNNAPKDIEKLFDGAMSIYKVHSLIWFIDPNKEIYQRHKKQIRWGILDKLLGEKKVAVVTRNQRKRYNSKTPIFVSAFDLI